MNMRLKPGAPTKIFSADDIFAIMQRILMRENRIDRKREHFWTICVDTAHTILNIELVSLGSINNTVVEPMEVFSIPLQKRAVKIILVHNHPSGNLNPSPQDKDVTDRLIQCGLIMHVHVLDHLIISTQGYYSFADSGLLKELEMSDKFVPDFKIKERLKREIEEKSIEASKLEKARETASVMMADGEPIEKIIKYTGLSRVVIKGIKI